MAVTDGLIVGEEVFTGGNAGEDLLFVGFFGGEVVLGEGSEGAEEEEGDHEGEEEP